MGETKGPVRVSFGAGEAMYVLDALTVASAKAWETVRKMTVTSAPQDELSIAETAAVMLDRAHKRLDGALYPTCRWLDNEDCNRAVTGYDERGVPYCAIHLNHVRRVRELVAS